MQGIEKQILLEQLKDRVKRGLAVFIYLFNQLEDNTLTPTEEKGIIDVIKGLQVIVNAMIDIQKGNSLDEYEDLVYSLANQENLCNCNNNNNSNNNYKE